MVTESRNFSQVVHNSDVQLLDGESWSFLSQLWEYTCDSLNIYKMGMYMVFAFLL